MFDFSWSEIFVLGVVAIVFIGPRDLPKALHTLSKAIKSIRGMAAEFQSQVEDIARSADLQDIGHKLRSEWESFDIKKQVEKTIDPDNTLKSVSEIKTLPASTDSSDVVVSDALRLDENLEQEAKEEERRISILKECPSILEPKKAMRIYEERRAEKQRPSCLPPEFAIHKGRRVIVHTRDEDVL